MSTHGFDIHIDFKRDRWGRPLIEIPGSDKPQAYTRVSGYGSVLENQSGLTKWKQRMVLAGALERPDLLKLASAARGDDKRMSSLAEELLEAGGASRAANTGTAIHDALSQLDMGTTTIADLPDDFRGHGEAWVKCLEAHGLEVVPDLVECHLVNDRYQAAGSGDNFLRRISDGKLIAVDKKTGKSISPRPLAYMVQLYLYATSMLYDVQTGQRKSIGAVDETVAYIAHIPADGNTCTLYEVDLVAAAELTALAEQVRKAEKETAKVIALDAPAKKAPAKATAVEPLLAARRSWCRDRLALALKNDEAKRVIGLVWPEGVPGFKEPYQHSHDEIDRIAKCLDRVEADCSLPFGATDPKQEQQNAVDEALFRRTFPGARVIQDETNIDDATYEALKAHIDTLPLAQTAWIAERTKEASAAKKPLSLRQSRTRTRYELVRALVALSVFHDADDVVRALIQLTEEATLNPNAKVGALVGGLNHAQAIDLQKISDAIDTGALTLSWDENAKPIIVGDVPALLAA